MRVFLNNIHSVSSSRQGCRRWCDTTRRRTAGWFLARGRRDRDRYRYRYRIKFNTTTKHNNTASQTRQVKRPGPIILPLSFQKCQGVPFSPNLSKLITFAAAPLVLTAFVRNQELIVSNLSCWRSFSSLSCQVLYIY